MATRDAGNAAMQAIPCRSCEAARAHALRHDAHCLPIVHGSSGAASFVQMLELRRQRRGGDENCRHGAPTPRVLAVKRIAGLAKSVSCSVGLKNYTHGDAS